MRTHSGSALFGVRILPTRDGMRWPCWLVLGLIALALLLLSGCASRGGPEQVPPAAQSGSRFPTDGVPPYRPPPGPDSAPLPTAPAGTDAGRTTVALLLPLSGQHAAIGEAMLNAANMALFDLGGDSFTLLPRDTQGTPEGAAEAARDALSQGAKLILGPLLASSIVAARDATSGSGIPIIGFSNDRSVAGNGVLIMGFLPEAEVRRVVTHAAKQGMRRFGMFARDTRYARLVGRALDETAQRTGGAVLRVVSVPRDAGGMELGRAAEAFAVSGPYDAVMLPMGGEALNEAAAALAAAGFDPARTRFLGTSQWDQQALLHEPALVGGRFAAPPPQAREEFTRRFTEVYGQPPPRFATMAYDATALAALLAAQPGGPNYDFATLTAPRGFSGADGFFRFAADGTAERGLAILEIIPGGVRVVDPAPMRAEDLIF